METQQEFSLPEVAKQLGVSYGTVYLWARKNKIKTRKGGILAGSPRYVHRKELDRLKREMGMAG